MPYKGADIRNDRRFRKLRKKILMEHPICQYCGKAQSTQIDHIQSVSEGGTNERSNLAAVCKACNDIKARGEKRRGIWRYHGAPRGSENPGFCIHGWPFKDPLLGPCKECSL